MATIHVHEEHRLGIVIARQKIEEVAQQLKDRLGVSYHWAGNELHFERTGTHGTILVEENAVTVDVALGIMFAAFKGEIERQLKALLQQNLT
ncbi:MAG TPA: polyhydroxyalkanoic acid system family protein [Candidatus Kapabacteria bacterium]|jgi:putative polyhydroxyalkanoate system protein|nr:polyhydroxyalkanoic acid system family protein [Candidatus Kapabacteria bacterium]